MFFVVYNTIVFAGTENKYSFISAVFRTVKYSLSMTDTLYALLKMFILMKLMLLKYTCCC